MVRMMILAALVALFLPLALVAQAADSDSPEAGLGVCKLTDEQRAQLDEINAQQQKQMIDLNAAVEKLEIDQRKAMEEENYAQARKLVDQITAKRAEMEKLNITRIEQFSKILTAEQKKAWHQMRMERRHGMRCGMNDGPNMGPGMQSCGEHQGMQPRGRAMQACGGHGPAMQPMGGPCQMNGPAWGGCNAPCPQVDEAQDGE